MYASSDNGEGHVQEIGSTDNISTFEIRVGMFAKDVVITIEEDFTNEEED